MCENNRCNLFTASGGNNIHVINFTDPSAADLVSYVEIAADPSEGQINDIESCGVSWPKQNKCESFN